MLQNNRSVDVKQLIWSGRVLMFWCSCSSTSACSHLLLKSLKTIIKRRGEKKDKCPLRLTNFVHRGPCDEVPCGTFPVDKTCDALNVTLTFMFGVENIRSVSDGNLLKDRNLM